MKIYHNPRCKTCRTGLEYLEKKQIKIEVIQYLKDSPFTVETLTALLKKAGQKPQEMIRTHEEIYKKNYKEKTFTDEEWIAIMVEHPRLIKRPIIETEDTALWGNSPENIDQIL